MPTPAPTADAPNTCAAVTADSAQATWLENTIAVAGDEDWYRFSISARQTVRILVGHLPSNYRIDLYTDCGSLTASSNRFNNEFEEISRTLDPGTYHVRVRGWSGAFNASVAYGLKFIGYATGVHILSSTAWTTSAGYLNVDGELLNNTGDRLRLIQVRANLFDAAGNLLASKKDWAWINVLRPGLRSPFRVTFAPQPAGYDHYTVEVAYSQKTSDYVVQKMSITSSSLGMDANGIWFHGTVLNRNSFNTNWTTTITTLWDEWGNVLNLDARWTSPYTIVPNGTATYDVRFTEHYAGWNKAYVGLQGSKPT